MEARSGLVLAYTTTTVSMVSYSTVMGVVGGGGIGDFAVRVGYQRYEYGIMYVAIVIMIALVFIYKCLGTSLPKTRQKVGGQKNEEVLFSNIRCYCNSYFSCLWGNKQADQKEDKEITVAVHGIFKRYLGDCQERS